VYGIGAVQLAGRVAVCPPGPIVVLCAARLVGECVRHSMICISWESFRVAEI